MIFLKILLFLFIAVAIILVFVVGPISDQLLPQQSDSFICTTSKGRTSLGERSCGFISAYYIHIDVILTSIIGVFLSYLSSFKDDLQAKKFRELALFLFKIAFIILVGIFIFFKILDYFNIKY